MGGRYDTWGPGRDIWRDIKQEQEACRKASNKRKEDRAVGGVKLAVI